MFTPCACVCARLLACACVFVRVSVQPCLDYSCVAPPRHNTACKVTATSTVIQFKISQCFISEFQSCTIQAFLELHVNKRLISKALLCVYEGTQSSMPARQRIIRGYGPKTAVLYYLAIWRSKTFCSRRIKSILMTVHPQWRE